MRARVRRAAAAMVAILAAGCAQREERFPTEWLRIDLVRPPGGGSGVVKLGEIEEEVYLRDSAGRGWRQVGVGHPVRYLVLDGGQAALVDLSRDGKGPRLARAGSTSFDPVHAAFGGEHLTVPPGAAAFDLYTCRARRKSGGCADAVIERRDAGGSVAATFPMVLAETHAACGLTRVHGYDREGAPYMVASCLRDPERKCLLVAARPGGPWVHEVKSDRPWAECSDFPRTGVALQDPERWELLD